MSRLSHRVRVTRARTQARVGFARLALATAHRQVDEVWIGDSHAVLLNTARFPFPGLDPVDDRRWVWHFGPRLMFSVARDGFQPAMVRLVRQLRRVPGHRQVTWFVCFGEIDVRCHLAPRLAEGADLSFVGQYVDRVRALAASLGDTDVVIVVPPPPCVDSFDHDAFPVVGSPEERVAAHRAVRDRLAEVVRAPGRRALRLLDLTPDLAEPSGLMVDALTDDGCHTNHAGRIVVRRSVEAFRQPQ